MQKERAPYEAIQNKDKQELEQHKQGAPERQANLDARKEASSQQMQKERAPHEAIQNKDKQELEQHKQRPSSEQLKTHPAVERLKDSSLHSDTQIASVHQNEAARETDAHREREASNQRESRDISHTYDGAIVIRSVVGPAEKRRGFERQYFPGVEVGLEGWERAHSQGAGTGKESAEAIRYAPREVNQALQNKGIEDKIRKLYQSAEAHGVTLHLTTETRTHPGTLRLASIIYRLDGVKDGQKPVRLFEAEIAVENKRKEPRVTISASPHGAWDG